MPCILTAVFDMPGGALSQRPPRWERRSRRVAFSRRALRAAGTERRRNVGTDRKHTPWERRLPAQRSAAAAELVPSGWVADILVTSLTHDARRSHYDWRWLKRPGESRSQSLVLQVFTLWGMVGSLCTSYKGLICEKSLLSEIGNICSSLFTVMLVYER